MADRGAARGGLPALHGPDRLTEWQPGLRGIRQLDGPLDRVGTTYTLHQAGPDLRIRITRVDPPRLHEQLEILRHHEWLATARFEPTARGGTRFTLDAEFRARSRLDRLILPLAALGGRWFGKKEFDRFKKVVERDGAVILSWPTWASPQPVTPSRHHADRIVRVAVPCSLGAVHVIIDQGGPSRWRPKGGSAIVPDDARTRRRESHAAAICGVILAAAALAVHAGPVRGASGCDIVGTNGDDIIYGTAKGEVICGKGGNDRLYGRGGDDTLRGGDGLDRLSGGRGRDTLIGGSGEDSLVGGPGADRLSGGPQGDWMDGGGGRDILRGGGGGDTMSGGARGDDIDGGAGDDVIDGGKGPDEIRGGPGADTIHDGPGDDRVWGDDDGDDINGGNYEPNGMDVYRGGKGDDEITSWDHGSIPDIVRGGPGNDGGCTDPADSVFGIEYDLPC